MCSYNDIDISRFEIFESLGDFTLALESRHNRYLESKSEESLKCFMEVLVSEYNQWRDKYCLLSCKNRSICCDKGKLCFSKSNIPDDQSVHIFIRVHILEYILSSLYLICCVVIGEARDKLIEFMLVIAHSLTSS